MFIDKKEFNEKDFEFDEVLHGVITGASFNWDRYPTAIINTEYDCSVQSFLYGIGERKDFIDVFHFFNYPKSLPAKTHIAVKIYRKNGLIVGLKKLISEEYLNGIS